MKEFLKPFIYRLIQFGNSYKPPNRYMADGTLTIGEHTYGIPIIIKHSGDQNRVIIGKFCSIADEVTIFAGGNHRIDWVSTYPLRAMFDLPGKYHDGHPASNGDVNIGSDVWIGYGATILSGVKIGHGAVIGARSLVSKDVPPYTIAAGNPAILIRERFNQTQIAKLLEIAWWDWSLEKILSFIDLLNMDNIDVFIEKAHPNKP